MALDYGQLLVPRNASGMHLVLGTRVGYSRVSSAVSLSPRDSSVWFP